MKSTDKRFSNIISDIKIQRWIVICFTLIIGGIFIFLGNNLNQSGFPLDDAWIHQTYARNLAQSGLWEYIPGQASAGSTSPLWTMLLSIGFILGFTEPYLWTSILSVAVLIGIALVINEILQHFFTESPFFGLAGSLFVILDWHLLWSSASGMETLLYSLASLYIFWLLISRKYWGWLGALCGLIIWIRPDGVTILGPIFLLMGIQIIYRKFNLRDGFLFFIPFLATLFVYILFIYSISGSLFPNTFYAKQMEYASVLQQPFIQRIGKILLVPVSGAGIFLIPGFVVSIYQAVKQRNWWLIATILWFFGYGVLYALRLPMTYQHGRYLMPMIPVLYLIGIMGSKQLLNLISKNEGWLQRIKKPVIVGLFVFNFIFAINGLQTIRMDIQTIDQLMVKPALWIKSNTEKEAIIAVHDIGAMGYFGERQIIDLAGLIQPELIPIIRDEAGIKLYLTNANADYLVVFRDWYPGLVDYGVVEENFTIPSLAGTEMVEIRKLR
ncbi:MAG: hypothetical protein CVU42_16210 [Chloroflexi bacterium HGW-Chloroflexi-4]|jgi:hypothetical protein|nr:MAG: hypothetical protein CVU42_16210 [Chloroflexi bacterium HGW-Chloroflexi-4]